MRLHFTIAITSGPVEITALNKQKGTVGRIILERPDRNANFFEYLAPVISLLTKHLESFL